MVTAVMVSLQTSAVWILALITKPLMGNFTLEQSQPFFVQLSSGSIVVFCTRAENRLLTFYVISAYKITL